MKIKGAIFDLDGTLLDSMPIWENIGSEYLISKGISPEPGINESLRVMSLCDAALYVKNKYSLPDSTEEMMNDINKMTEFHYFNDVLPKDGIINFLEYLKSKGVKMCIATATDRYLAQAALERNNMSCYFGKIFTCTEVGKGKNKPDIFIEALQYLGMDISSVCVFEDALYAAFTAKNAGFNLCSVFDKSEPDDQKLKNISDVYIKSFKEASEFFD